MNRFFWLSATLLALAPLPAFAGQVFPAVIAGTACKTDANKFQTCEYRAGKSLDVVISGVGTPAAGVVFLKSDLEGDYYAGFGTQHGCIFVKPGKASGITDPADVVFISPRNGRIYQNWHACQAGL
jgi:hypothetical protein